MQILTPVVKASVPISLMGLCLQDMATNVSLARTAATLLQFAHVHARAPRSVGG